MVEELGVLPEDNEGLIDTIRAIDGIIVAAFIEELAAEGKVRISPALERRRGSMSARSAQQFRGGGHTLAAGAARSAGTASTEVRSEQSSCRNCHDVCHEILTKLK